MPTTEYRKLRSRHDGLELSLMIVRPDGPAQALVQIAHGMSEHKERYEPFMRDLARRGCLCVINDHRGHGGSVRAKEDLGYFYRDGDRALVEDLHQITLWMRKSWPGLKLALLGHSMGSLAARAYCERYDADIDALVLLGSPGGQSGAALRFGLALIWLLTKLQGERRRSEILQRMTVGRFARRFSDDVHSCAWISANPENVAAYEADPLCNFVFTLNGDRTLLRLLRRAYRLSPRADRPDLPVRFFSGADDPCAPDERGFARALACMRQAGYANVQGRMFPGLRHEILNEQGREAIFAAIWEEGLAPWLLP